MTMRTVPFGALAGRVVRERAPEAWIHAGAYVTAALGILSSPPVAMGGWDVGMLAASAATGSVIALRWLALARVLTGALMVAGAIAAAAASGAPDLPDVGRALSSQALLLAMSGAVMAATVLHAVGWWRESGRLRRAAAAASWASLACGLAGMLVRWFESYHVSADRGGYLGHVPVSNLYEVFALFVIVVTALQLRLARNAALASASMLLSLPASAAAGFLVWYARFRGGDEFQPLVPALDSYWMKLHVPANFIGYGCFCLAACSSAAWLLAGRRALADRLPPRPLLEEATYRLIASGFVFFTIATILGSLWAAEAWGGYWSWDPKETWALVVWLNYAAWLHLRLVRGWRGPIAAWWALGGLLVTLFAFLGVNLYLSGLHSYGGL